MFYDMERDDPKEFKRRKNLFASKKNKVKSSMKTCLCEINKLRATTDGSWPELFDGNLYTGWMPKSVLIPSC